MSTTLEEIKAHLAAEMEQLKANFSMNSEITKDARRALNDLTTIMKGNLCSIGDKSSLGLLKGELLQWIRV